jgi:hypothetical protein
MCLALLFSGVANAQLPKDQQKCVNSINKGAAKVAKAYAGDMAACIKNAGKGKLGGQLPSECVVSDPKGKVAKAVSKIKVGDCVSVPGVPVEQVKENIDDIFLAKDLGLIAAIFGTDLDSVLVVTDKEVAGTKEAAKCQAAVAKALGKCQDAKLGTFNSCKKGALKDGTATNAGTLQDACLGTDAGSIPDGKGKISKKCGGDFGIGKKCGGQDLNALFPGAPSAAEMEVAIECEVCVALNALDGLSRNCDQFDNGVIDESCSGAPPIGSHKCDFVVTTEAPDLVDPNVDSTVTIITQALPLPAFRATGAVDIDCGGEGENGKAPCECLFQSFDPIDITGIGFICFTAATESCPVGEIDCDGGNPLDVDMDSDHNIGACTSSADCETQCAAHCGGLAGIGTYAAFNEACEGFCENSTNPGAPCSTDTDCPGGSCPGPDNTSGHPACNCDCNAVGGAASAAGTLQCNLGVEINVEVNPPCGDGDILIAVGTRCIPLTTALATSQLHNTNNSPAKDFPVPGFSRTGVGVGCSTLAGSVTTGVNLVGVVNFFDSTIGDLQSQLNLTCE